MALSKSKSHRPTKVVKPRDNKRRTTVSHRQHQFRSFAERISSLKIDPIRRRRDKQEQDEQTDIRASYFARSLSRWRDTNLSNTFTAFATQASRLADNLPLVLHHQDQIMTLLIEAIDCRDPLAMEPLMSLLADFAHDLDTHFERHFALAVGTVANVAAGMSDPAVVEWSFTCLAWLFKYLSRLLVPDLKPVFELMAPYLGRQRHKHYIVRFAAESLSFLLRKAAISHGHPEYLSNITEHILRTIDDEENTKSEFYTQGIMTLFTDAMKGVQHDFHSAGLPILKTLLTHSQASASRQRTSLVAGILTSLIHFSTVDTFRPLFNEILSRYDSEDWTRDSAVVEMKTEILFTLVSVRKGSRISDWQPILGCVSHMMQQSHGDPALRIPIMSLLAVALCNCPSTLQLQKMSFLDLTIEGEWSLLFLRLCDMVVRLDRSRFDLLLFTRLQRYVTNFGQSEGLHEDLLQVLPELVAAESMRKLKVPAKCLQELQQEVSSIATTLHGASDIVLSRYFLALKALPSIDVNAMGQTAIASSITVSIVSLLESKAESSSIVQQLVLGSGMQLLLNYDVSDDQCKAILSGLCRSAGQLLPQEQVWNNILALIRKPAIVGLAEADLTQLKSMLIQNLSLPSHEIRLASLEIIQELYNKTSGTVPLAIETAIAIETTPISLATTRSISLNIRRLGADYAETSSDPYLSKAIPSFCLGLMHIRLSQAWSDAIEALAQMAKLTQGEDTIMTILQDWLQACETAHGPADVEQLLDGNSATSHISSEFECPNLTKLSAIRDQVFGEVCSGRLDANDALRRSASFGPRIPLESRSQALKVLDRLSDIAEKRSRLLVPVLLNWAGPDAEAEDERSGSVRWSRKDQKALLSIFAKFHNPRVLFKSGDVHSALLKLCANGDVEIQKAALTALLSWKEVAVIRCQQNLLNVLDDAHFREELAVFLQGDDESGLRASDIQEVMPILLRLLYGRLVGGSKEGQQIRRKATFVALSRFDDTVMQMFIDISLHGVKSTAAVHDGHFNETAEQSLTVTPRQQVGVLNMLGDMLDTVGSRLAPFATQLLNAVMLCTITATRKLQQQDISQLSDTSLLRSVRQSGLLCIVKIYSGIQGFDRSSLSYVVRAELLETRLDSFVSENSQGISATLRLIASWSQNPDVAPLLWNGNANILPAVAQLLKAETTRDEIRLFLLTDVIENLLQDSIVQQISGQSLADFTDSIATLLSRGPEKLVLDSCVRIVSKLARSVVDVARAKSILDLSSKLLVQPAQAVPTRAKVHLLQTCIPLLQLDKVGFQGELYQAICGLFSRFVEAESRAVLTQAFAQLCSLAPEYDQVGAICIDLNAVSTTRLDEPDHAAQERAFVQVYDQSTTFTHRQWLPVMHNCLYFIRDENDMVNRSSAAKALQAMIRACSVDEGDGEKTALVQNDLFFAVQRGMVYKSEFVRAEHLLLLEHIIVHNREWQEVSDMTGLVNEAEDQVTVFADILSIQQHRRLQALKKLGQSSTLSSANISRIFLPLLDHFVFDQAPGDAGRTLADQTVQTIGQLAQRMRWTHQRKTLSRYYSLLKSKEDADKVILRLIGVVIDGLIHVLRTTAEAEEAVTPNALATQSEEHRFELPANRAGIVSKELLPPLISFLHQKDESKVDRRVAVAISVVKLLKLLPEEEFIGKLAAALTDISHILKSRDFEAREQTRRALSTILQLIGPQFLGYMLKELRGALQRGYQLHVLSYTVHHLLVNSSATSKVGEFDACVDELCAIVMDDIFGTTGLEKDTEEYRSNMKEIKSSKSYDTMEILARTTSIRCLGKLLSPLQAMLYERLDSNMVKKVDNLLLRLQQGIDQNPDANSRDMLSLCYELARDSQRDKSVLTHTEQSHRKYFPNKSVKNNGKSVDSSSFEHKITAFAFAALRKVLRRHENLQTTQNLTAFLPLIADALIVGQDEVKIEAAKLLSTILHVRLPDLDNTISIYLKEAIKMVKDSKSTATDGARAGLELSTAVLRERRDAQIRETDVAMLLRCIKVDLDQPGQQGQMYRFLRAVLGRKIVVTEVYEVMDEVAKSMVNNPDEGVRQNARAAYVQFLVDFPQSKDRWAKTVGFLIKNFGFDHAGGRKSTLEAVHALLGRLSDTVVQEILLSLYVGLVPRLISDPERSCREMAAALIAQVLDKAETAESNKIKSLTTKWLLNDSKGGIHVAAMDCWSIILRAQKANAKETSALIEAVTNTLSTISSASSQQSMHKKTIAAFDLLLTLCETKPQQAFAAQTKSLWQVTGKLLASSSVQIREHSLGAQRLLFNEVARTSFINNQFAAGGQLASAGGLQLDLQDLRESCLAHLQCLRQLDGTGSVSSEDLARNLLFLGRAFAARNIEWHRAHDQDDISEDEEQTATPARDTSAFGYLFSRLAFILRRENAPVQARITALQTAGALLSITPDILRYVQLLVRPLYVLTDSTIARREEEEYQALSDKSREVLDLIEKKVGPETYVSLLSDARRAVIGKRDERRQKRKIEAVAQPEKWEKDKRKRHDTKKMKSKSRAQENRAKRAIY